MLVLCQCSAVNVFVSVSCVFVSVCKKKKIYICLYTVSSSFTVRSFSHQVNYLVLSLSFQDISCCKCR